MQTKPLLLLRKFSSVLISAVVIEAVSFAVSLTDSLVAGNRIGADALAAIGLFSPFLSVSTFFEATINSGTMMLLTTDIGKFDRKRATEHFSQGCIIAVLTGVLFTLAVALIKPLFISGASVMPEIREHLERYYDIVKYYFLFAYLSCLLDNSVVIDGGEKLSAIANSIQIVGNVVLSFLLSKPFGIVGIAAATVGCKAAFILLISLWFFRKKCTIRFVWHFSFKDLRAVLAKGVLRSCPFVASALMLWLMNRFVLAHYSITTFQVWVIVQKVIGLSAIYDGFTMTLRPFLSTLLEENNTKAMRVITVRLVRDLVMMGLLLTVMLAAFPAQILDLFGIKEADAIMQGTAALRIVGMASVFEALNVMLTTYYYLIDRQMLSVISCLLKDLICPVGMVFLLANIKKGEPDLFWAGLAISNLLSLLIILTIVWIRYKRSLFPLLLPREQDSRIHIHAFDVTPENITRISETAGKEIREAGFSKRLQNYAGVCIEDMLNFVTERNPEPQNAVHAECTLIMEERGVRVILRDDGRNFDIADEDPSGYSFTKFTIDRLLVLSEHHVYITTTGYNRNEIMFTDSPEPKTASSLQ